MRGKINLKEIKIGKIITAIGCILLLVFLITGNCALGLIGALLTLLGIILMVIFKI